MGEDGADSHRDLRQRKAKMMQPQLFVFNYGDKNRRYLGAVVVLAVNATIKLATSSSLGNMF